MKSNQRCPRCGVGRVITYKTRTTAEHRTRYVKCNHCGETGKHVLRSSAGDFVPTVGTDIVDSSPQAETMKP